MRFSVVPALSPVLTAARSSAAFLTLIFAMSAVLAQDPTVEAPAAPLTTVAFNNPGNFQWTVPAGVTSIQVQVWGGGGGGGNAQGSFSFPFFLRGCGGGGGGGGYSKSVVTVVPGATYPVSVGTGGNPGSHGADSNFGFGLVLAFGGAPGGLGVGGTPGSGGSGATGVGNGVKFAGGDGAPGSIANTPFSGGGGSGAGTGAAGTDGAGPNGAIPPVGGGNGGNGVVDGSGPTVPQNGGTPGGGGGGALSPDTNGRPGTQGGAGRIVIVYPPTFTASGRVVTPQGRGIRGATVTVTGNGLANPIIVHVGRYGNYTVPSLNLGTYTFTYSARRFTFAPTTRTVASLDGNVSVSNVISN
jgi:hypothetical protein